MRLGRTLSRVAGVGVALLVAGAFVGSAGARAGVEVPFAPRFATNGRAGVTIAANTLMSCPASGVTEIECLAARNGEGGALNNNAYAMVPVNVEVGNPEIFDSSRATLTLPPGATVEFAGLYYGARTSKGAGGAEATDPAARGTVLLRAPGGLGFHLAGGGGQRQRRDQSRLHRLRRRHRPGRGRRIGRIHRRRRPGRDRRRPLLPAGRWWSPTATRRHRRKASASMTDSPRSCRAARSNSASAVWRRRRLGTVSTEVGVVAYEGDRGGVNNDQLLLAGKPLSDAVNPAKKRPSTARSQSMVPTLRPRNRAIPTSSASTPI